MSNKQMSIFNLLDGIVEPDKDDMVKSMIRSKTFHEIRPNSVKTMGGIKQKGLSIRSNSAMNISQSKHSDTVKKNTHGNKEQNFLKSKITQVDINGCPISPGMEAKKLSSKFKKPFPKEQTIKKTTKTTLNNGILKEPVSFKKNIKEFPEPEKLAPWFDDQHEFDYGYIDTIDKELKEMLLKKKENFGQEKTLISETSDLVEIPDLISDRSINENYTNCLFPALPEISDISDDDYL